MFDFDALEEHASKLDQDTPTIKGLSSRAKRLFGDLGSVEDIQVPEGATVRVLTISDIHVDYPANAKWLQSHLPKHTPTVYNVLILPGDLTDDCTLLRTILGMFTSSFDLVCYTPGNHDLWVRRKGDPPDSMMKFRQVMEVCRELKVRTSPVWLRCPGMGAENDVVLVPLLSWYTSEWDNEPDLPWVPPKSKEEMQAMWMDFMAIKWPKELVTEIQQRGQKFSFDGTTSPGLSDIFACANETWLSDLLPRVCNSQRPAAVISYSHFIPRQEIFPEKRFLFEGDLHKVSGSDLLDNQIRSLRADVHVCGHTHIPIDITVEGHRYVQWCLGSPSEQRGQTRSVSSSGILVIYDGSVALPQMRFPPQQFTFWGEYFRKYGRTPTEYCPAPWVRRRFNGDCKIPYSEEDYLRTPRPDKPPEGYPFEPQWRS